MVSAGIDANYGLVIYPSNQPFPAGSDPLLVQNIVDFDTFTLPGSPFMQLPTMMGGAVEQGSTAVLEALNAFNPMTTVNYRPDSKIALVLVTDEDDDSPTVDFLAAQSAIATSDAVFSYIGTPGGFGNSDATYGVLAANSGGGAFRISDFRADPTNFFNQFSQFLVGTLIQRTEYEYDASGNYVVWSAKDGNDYDIFLYDAVKDVVIQVTDNATDDILPRIHGSNVVWVGRDGEFAADGSGDDAEIFLYNIETGITTQLTDNFVAETDPRVSATHVTWLRDTGVPIDPADPTAGTVHDVYVFDIVNGIDEGNVVVQPAVNASARIPNHAGKADYAPRISGSNVVWYGHDGQDLEIYLYNAVARTARQITSNVTEDRDVDISGPNVVWRTFDGTDYELVLYQIDTNRYTRITDNDSDETGVQISGNNIVWEGFDDEQGDWDIYHYDMATGTTTNLSNNVRRDESRPQIHGDRVVWESRYQAGNGGYEIMFYELGSKRLAENLSRDPGADEFPLVTDTLVAWRNDDGEQQRIMVATKGDPEATATVTLVVNGDVIVEPDETFRFVIDDARVDVPDLGPTTVIVDKGSADVLILNDDGELDFGDAPKPYPSLVADNGARHLVGPSLRLGPTIDSEPDAWPHHRARGDDNHGLDDEDGVLLDGVVLVAGQLNEITVNVVNTTGEFAYVNAWIDFNGDGDWDDPGEHLGTLATNFSGPRTFQFLVPHDATRRATFARFRLSSEPDLGPTGYAPDGEVEDYQVFVVREALDYGDAPDPYPTRIDQGGASHVVVDGLRLGNAIDVDFDGQPHAAALGDDRVGLDDEDGVTFDTHLVPGQQATVSIDVRNTTGTQAYVNAWIDFNGDGDWNDPGEQILFGRPVQPGVNQFVFDVPRLFDQFSPVGTPYSVVGESFARFRLSTEQYLSVYGVAQDGEVEDYRVAVDDGQSVVRGRVFDDRNGDGVFNSGIEGFAPPVQPAPVGALALSNTDQGVLGPVNLGFTFQYYGGNYGQLYISNNGAVSFGQPAAAFQADGFAGLLTPIIAPFWADADTRKDGGGVHIARGTSERGNPFIQIDWVDVGYFDRNSLSNRDLRNNVTLYIEDDPGGDIVSFFYGDMQWTTGMRDSGVVGFGGQGAVIGFNAGDGVNSYTQMRPSAPEHLTALMNQAQFSYRFSPITGVPGDIEPGLAGVTVYLDLNNNGALDPGEPSTITARDNLGTPEDETGNFEFTGLQAGQYVVRQVVGANWSQTTPPQDGLFLPDADGNKIQTLAGWRFADGLTFSVSDGKTQIVFEFEDMAIGDGREFPNNNVLVEFNAFFTPSEMAQTIADAINDAVNTLPPGKDFDVTATVVGDVVHLDGQSVTVDPRLAPLTVLGDSRSEYDAQRTPPGSYLVELGVADDVDGLLFGNFRTAHVAVGDVAVAEGNLGTTPVQIEFHLTGSFGAPIEVSYRTRPGTARDAGDGSEHDDFVPAEGSFMFSPQDIPVGEWTTQVLTQNAQNDYDYRLSGNSVVYEAFVDNNWEIFLHDYRTGETTRLTNNTTADRLPDVFEVDHDTTYVVWSGVPQGETDTEIFLYDSSTGQTQRLTYNTFDDKAPQVSGSHVVWWAQTPTSNEIYLYDIRTGLAPVNISNSSYHDYGPQISGSNVVWYGSDGSDLEIFLYEASKGYVTQLTYNETRDQLPRIDGNNVVWEGRVPNPTDGALRDEIFLYQINTGITTQLTTNDTNDNNPMISGNNVVWQGFVGTNQEIFHYDLSALNVSLAPGVISNNPYQDQHPQVYGDRVVWHGFDGSDWEVYFYQLGSDVAPVAVSQNAVHDWYPQVSEDLVVWRSHQEGNYEIMLATQEEPRLTATVTVYVQGDLFIEDDEDFFVTITDIKVLGAQDQTRSEEHHV